MVPSKNARDASLGRNWDSLNLTGDLLIVAILRSDPTVHSIMNATNTLRITMALLLWIPILFFSALLSHNAILYFTHGGEYGILPEKVAAQSDMLWNISFYTHLPAGIICLFAPVLLFARRFYRKNLGLHKKIGTLYVWVTLAVVCPTGMYLALYAKGGLVTQAGFMIQGILLAAFTYRGYRAIQAGNRIAHFHDMIRSYAVATVVLSFRIFHILFFVLNVPYQDNYAISQWLGLSGNLLLAEVIILFTDRSISKHNTLKSQRYETA